MSFKIFKAVGAVADAITLTAQQGAPKVAETTVAGLDGLAQAAWRLSGEIAYSNHRRISKLLRSPKREKREAAVYAARHIRELQDSLK